MCCRFASNNDLIIVSYIRSLFDAKMQRMRAFRKGVFFFNVNDKIIIIVYLYGFIDIYN